MMKPFIKKLGISAIFLLSPLANADININISDINTLIEGGTLNGHSLSSELVKEMEEKLDGENIRVDDGVLTANLTQPDTKKLGKQNGGCTWFKLYNIIGNARVNNNSNINFDINGIEDTTRANVVVKADLKVTARLYARYGWHIFGRCRVIADLRADVLAKTDITARIDAALNLNQFEQNGKLMIDPTVKINAQVSNSTPRVGVDSNAKILKYWTDGYIYLQARKEVIDIIAEFKKDLPTKVEKYEKELNQDLKPEAVVIKGLPATINNDALKALLFGAFSTEIPDEYIAAHYEELLVLLLSNDDKRITEHLKNGILCEIMYKDLSIPLQSNSSAKNNGSFYPTSFAQFCRAFDKEQYGKDSNKRWTLAPEQTLDLGVVSLSGNTQPYRQQSIYKTINTNQGQCKLEMRIYKKDVNETSLKPLMAFHGGGWRNRHLAFTGTESQFSHYTDAGFVVFAPFYRLVGNIDPYAECNNSNYYEITEDVADAFKWVQQNAANYGAGSQNISLLGQSAGAHLVTWLATQNEFAPSIEKVVTYYPPADMAHFAKAVKDNDSDYLHTTDFGLAQKIISEFIGMTPAEINQNPRAPVILENTFTETIASNPWAYPPFFIMHGTDDQLVPAVQGMRLCNSLNGDPNDNIPANETTPTYSQYNCDTKGSQLYLVSDVGHTFDYCAVGLMCDAATLGERTAVSKAVQRSLQWLQQEGNIPGPIVYKPQVQLVNPSLNAVDLILNWQSDNAISCRVDLRLNNSVLVSQSLNGQEGTQVLSLPSNKFKSGNIFQAEIVCSGRDETSSAKVDFSITRNTGYTETGCNRSVNFVGGKTHYLHKAIYYFNDKEFSRGSCIKYRTLNHYLNDFSNWWRVTGFKRHKTADVRTSSALEKNDFLYQRQTAHKTGHRTPYVKTNKRNCIIDYKITTQTFNPLGTVIATTYVNKSWKKRISWSWWESKKKCKTSHLTLTESKITW